jgi:invasion protein IalB
VRQSQRRSPPQRSFQAVQRPRKAPHWKCRNSSVRRSAKFCGKGDERGAKEVCFTGKDTRTEAGQPVVAATLIESAGKQGKLFRVALPRPLQEQYGARLIVDTEPAISTLFSRCFANACMADYEATPELVSKLKKARRCISRQPTLPPLRSPSRFRS